MEQNSVVVYTVSNGSAQTQVKQSGK